MKKLKFNLFIISTFLIIWFMAIKFIQINNDHVECGTEISYYKDKQGETVKVKKHICKEKYNF